MTPDQKTCLEALAELTRPHGEMCVPFAPIMAETGLDRRVVRRNVRALARKGLAEFYRALWSEDGGRPAGAGYCITYAGMALVERTEGEGE